MRIIYNRICCNLCGEQIESRTVHDRVMCRCGNCGVDGGQQYLLRLGKKGKHHRAVRDGRRFLGKRVLHLKKSLLSMKENF